MWVFDGEEWKQEGAGEEKQTPETAARPFDAYGPELQVIEVVQDQPRRGSGVGRTLCAQDFDPTSEP